MVIGLLIVSAFFSVIAGGTTNSDSQIVVKSSKLVITRSDLERSILIRWGISEAPDFGNPEQQNRFEVKMAKDLINRRLFLLDAHRKGIHINSELVDKHLKKEIKNRGGEQGFSTFLARIKFSRTEYENVIRENLIAKKYIDQLVASRQEQITYTETELRNAYEQEPERYTKPERIRVRHIFRRFPEQTNSDQEKSIFSEILKLRDLAMQTGTDFKQLAKTHSDGPSAPYGGDLGFFSRGEMELSFEQQAFALNPGEVSQPVKTRLGYHLIKLIERQGAEKGDFQQAREQIVKALNEKHREEVLNKTTRKLWEAADVELLI